MVIGVLGKIDKRRNDFDSDDRTSYDAFAALSESFANIELMQLIRRSSIRFLIDSEGLGDTPNKQNCILCVQMHCLPLLYRIRYNLSYTEKNVIPNSDNRPVLPGIYILKFGITFLFLLKSLSE